MIALSSLVVGMVLASKFGLSPVSMAGPLDIPTANSAPLDGPFDAGTFRTIAQEASSTVVSIRTTARRQGASIEDFFGFENPFRGQGRGGRQAPPPQLVQGAGSGFIIDKAGHILTNNHVVDDATEIEVKLAGMDEYGEWLPAKVIGTDLLTDSALLQLTSLPEEALSVSKFGDSSQIAPGDWVMAIGNPFSLSNTVTVGVVSAVGRLQQTAVQQRFEQMIQTDAAINRGNSGGPLLNIRGEVVGMNTQIVSDGGGGNLGVGFAVPINTIRNILPQLMKGKVVRGRIGVLVDRRPMTKADAEDLGLSGVMGAIVNEVGEGPASKAGMRVGDVIVEFGGKPVKNSDELVSMVSATAPGTTVPVKVMRNKRSQTINITIEELDVEAERDERVQAQPESRPDEPTVTGFGMSIEPVTPARARRLNLPAGTGGAIVSDVEPGGAASRGGIIPGDVITDINGQKVTSVDQVSKALEAVADGRTARIIVVRGGREVLVMVRKR
jgi:serine protease Do